MRKIFFIIGILIICAIAYTIFNKSYYPALPIENMSKKEVLQTVQQSDEKVVKLTKENDSTWYIIQEKNADETIKKLVEKNGWEFIQKDGAGLFFENKDEKLIVTTQKWTKDFVLVQSPVTFNTKYYEYVGESEHWTATYDYQILEAFDDQFLLTIIYKGDANDLAKVNKYGYSLLSRSLSFEYSDNEATPAQKAVIQDAGSFSRKYPLQKDEVITLIVNWDGYKSELIELKYKP